MNNIYLLRLYITVDVRVKKTYWKEGFTWVFYYLVGNIKRLNTNFHASLAWIATNIYLDHRDIVLVAVSLDEFVLDRHADVWRRRDRKYAHHHHIRLLVEVPCAIEDATDQTSIVSGACQYLDQTLTASTWRPVINEIELECVIIDIIRRLGTDQYRGAKSFHWR